MLLCSNFNSRLQVPPVGDLVVRSNVMQCLRHHFDPLFFAHFFRQCLYRRAVPCGLCYDALYFALIGALSTALCPKKTHFRSFCNEVGCNNESSVHWLRHHFDPLSFARFRQRHCHRTVRSSLRCSIFRADWCTFDGDCVKNWASGQGLPRDLKALGPDPGTPFSTYTGF